MSFFNKIEITEKEMGPYKVVFKEHIGDYKETGKIMDEIYYSLLDEGVETYKGFGIYYDDPKVVEKDKLRSIAGSIIEEKDYDKIDQLKDKYNIKTIDKTRSITTEFPFRIRCPLCLAL
jgi:DNA gyrase inhibitor GyrI